MTFPTNYCVRAAHYFFYAAAVVEVCGRTHAALEGTLRGSTVFKVARRAGRWYILVARLENTIAPGRRASDFASPGLVVLQFCCFDFNKPLLEMVAYFLSVHFKSNHILFTIHTCFESE